MGGETPNLKKILFQSNSSCYRMYTSSFKASGYSHSARDCFVPGGAFAWLNDGPNAVEQK
jgi:hypothetical protein